MFLYAPVGLAVTVVEELPELAEKGRSRLTRHTTTARAVGQFAVAEGRRRLRLVDPPAPTPPGGARPSRPERATPPASPAAPAGSTASAPPHPAPAGDGAADGAWTRSVPADANGATTHAAGEAPSGAPAGADHPDAVPGAPAPAPASASLAIPGYDSLSAPQVVQRLESLSADELAAVAAYESAVRGRRTILARIAQLQHR